MAKTKKKKKKITSHHNPESNRLPKGARELKEDIDYFSLKPVFSFAHVDDNKWTIAEWKKNELKDLIKCFKKLEQCTWHQILRHNGFKYTALNIKTPQHVSPDRVIHEIRVDKVKRIHGFVDKNVFNIIWFDRDHSVCPENKNRKYG